MLFNKIKWMVVALLLATTTTYAQQTTQYSMYMLNQYLINPAVGGTEDFTDIKLGYRTQWVGSGLPNTPRSFFATGHTALGKKASGYDDVKPVPHHGIGGTLNQESNNIFTRLTVQASYAYHIPLSAKLSLSIGASIGIKQTTVDFDRLTTTEQEGLAGKQSQISPDGSVGMWLYHRNYYVGISTLQLFNNKVNIGETPTASATGQLNRHYYGTAGYRFRLNEDFTLIPSVLVKGVYPAPAALDLNLKLRYKDVVYLGASYRNQDAFIALIGVVIKKQYEVAYAYDFGLSSLNSYHQGSHEFLIGVRLPKKAQGLPPAQFW
jgi:type IX secretion system PorP/SprF family membrane protein